MPADSDHPDPDRWWRARRRFAVTAGVLAVAEGVYLLGFGDVTDYVVAWTMGPLVTVVVTYIGGASAVDAVASMRR